MSDGLDGASAFLGGADPAVIEQLHAQYLRDPASVDASWRRLFESEEGRAGGGGAPAEAATDPGADAGTEDRARSLGLPEARPPAAAARRTRTARFRPRPSIPSAPSC